MAVQNSSSVQRAASADDTLSTRQQQIEVHTAGRQQIIELEKELDKI